MVPPHIIEAILSDDLLDRIKAPGGWLYRHFDPNNNASAVALAFVPDDGLTGRRVREKFADSISRQPREGVVLRVELAPPWDCDDMAFYVALVRYDDGRHETVPVRLLRVIDPTTDTEVSK